MSDQKPRAIALRVLHRRQDGAFVEHLLETALSGTNLSAADRHLCQELVYGIVRWQATLDWLIARKTSNRAQKPLLQEILRLGLYQTFWLDRIPEHAAVNETVELARQSGFGPQSGFVNAILRGYLRESQGTRELLVELKKTHPAIGYSHPEWLVKRWQTRWGDAGTAILLDWNNKPPGTYARVNELRTDASKLLAQWRDENVAYDFCNRDWLPENLVFELKSHPALTHLPSFHDGFFYIQDPSTTLAVTELQPAPGEKVLDLCAAPGGKLTYAAQLMRNNGHLFAFDLDAKRLKLVHENCRRLGVSCVEVLAADPSSLASLNNLDRILIDAPCSNTGVLRRRVDLRWRLQPSEILRLKELQLGLLRQAAPLLKVGGTLVYSTCSIEPDENRAVIHHFLDENTHFQLMHERELLPFKDQVDGAYVARLKRRM